MTWNINPLAKENFQRTRLIEAHNSIYNYDLISICETSLNDTVELPETLLNGYALVPVNNPANNSYCGVGPLMSAYETLILKVKPKSLQLISKTSKEYRKVVLVIIHKK